MLVSRVICTESTYSVEPRKKKAKRIRFLDDSGLTGFRYKFVY